MEAKHILLVLVIVLFVLVLVRLFTQPTTPERTVELTPQATGSQYIYS